MKSGSSLNTEKNLNERINDRLVKLNSKGCLNKGIAFFNSQPKFSQYSVGKIQDTVAQIARKIKKCMNIH